MTSEASGVRAPADSLSELAERLVETGIPWKHPARRSPCPGPPTPGRRRCGSGAGSRTRGRRPPSGRSRSAAARTAAIPIVDEWSVNRSKLGSSGAGRPRGTSPTSATPCAPRSNTADASRPPTTSTSAPGTAGADEAQRRGSRASDTTPTSERRPVNVVERARSTIRAPARRCRRRTTCRSAWAARRSTTSTAAPARKPVTTALDRNCAIQPSLKTASSRNSTPVTSVIAATSWAACAPPRPVTSTAPPATAASDELGPGGDLPRRAEQRVDERPGSRRVEAVLQRHAGDARVAEVLRDDQRRHGDARRDVAAQPAPVVARQPLDDRKQPAQHHCHL